MDTHALWSKKGEGSKEAVMMMWLCVQRVLGSVREATETRETESRQVLEQGGGEKRG